MAIAGQNKQLELALGNILRGGVVLASLVVGLGGVLFLVRNGTETPHYETFEESPQFWASIPGIFSAVLEVESRGLIQLGILLLIATPIARVAYSVFVFICQHDRVYIVVTALELTLLLFSVLLGLLGLF